MNWRTPWTLALCAGWTFLASGCYDRKEAWERARDRTLEAKNRYAAAKTEENFSRARLDYFKQQNDSDALFREDIQHQKHSRKLVGLEQEIRRLKAEEDSLRAKMSR